MNLINTNMLSSNQQHDANRLITICKEHDKTSGISFLDANMNAMPDFPCFFLCYQKGILVGILSIFLPSSTECEVYAYTHPDYRQQGIFQKLWKQAKHKLNQYSIHDIFFVMDPKCQSGIQLLVTMDAYLHNSEYMLEFSGKPTLTPRGILTLSSFRKGSTAYYTASKDEEPVGTCCVDHSFGSSTIYNFEIKEEHRGKKWGTEFLLLLLKDLINAGNSKILLHVSSTNKAAYHLYLHHGFTMNTQIDYWKL